MGISLFGYEWLELLMLVSPFARPKSCFYPTREPTQPPRFSKHLYNLVHRSVWKGHGFISRAVS
jgi:hypothetical protein